MRLLFAVALSLSMGVSGAAQEKYAKPSSSGAKVHRSVPTERMPAATSSTSKELRNLEKQTAKTQQVRAPKQRSVALKPEKDKPNPPINFGGSKGAGKGGVNRGSSPYKGRLKQKGGGNRR